MTVSDSQLSWLNELRSGDLCIDGGAHEGNITDCLIAHQLRVIAVEPQSNCVAILRRRFQGRTAVAIEPCALSETDGCAVLYECDSNTELTTTSRLYLEKSVFAISGSYKWPRMQIVNAITLDSLIRKYGPPRLIKLDIEGSESVALKGLSIPVERIVFEFGSSLPSVMQDATELITSLGSYRFNFCTGDFLGDGELFFDRWVDSACVLNAIGRVGCEWGSIFARFG